MPPAGCRGDSSPGSTGETQPGKHSWALTEYLKSFRQWVVPPPATKSRRPLCVRVLPPPPPKGSPPPPPPAPAQETTPAKVAPTEKPLTPTHKTFPSVQPPVHPPSHATTSPVIVLNLPPASKTNNAIIASLVLLAVIVAYLIFLYTRNGSSQSRQMICLECSRHLRTTREEEYIEVSTTSPPPSAPCSPCFRANSQIPTTRPILVQPEVKESRHFNVYPPPPVYVCPQIKSQLSPRATLYRDKNFHNQNQEGLKMGKSSILTMRKGDSGVTEEIQDSYLFDGEAPRTNYVKAGGIPAGRDQSQPVIQGTRGQRGTQGETLAALSNSYDSQVLYGTKYQTFVTDGERGLLHYTRESRVSPSGAKSYVASTTGMEIPQSQTETSAVTRAFGTDSTSAQSHENPCTTPGPCDCEHSVDNNASSRHSSIKQNTPEVIDLFESEKGRPENTSRKSLRKKRGEKSQTKPSKVQGSEQTQSLPQPSYPSYKPPVCHVAPSIDSLTDVGRNERIIGML